MTAPWHISGVVVSLDETGDYPLLVVTAARELDKREVAARQRAATPPAFRDLLISIVKGGS